MIGAFDDIVESPIEPVKVEVNEPAVRSITGHSSLRQPHPLISGVGSLAPAQSLQTQIAVLDSGPQHKGIEFSNGRVGKEGVPEAAGPVLTAKKEAK